MTLPEQILWEYKVIYFSWSFEQGSLDVSAAYIEKEMNWMGSKGWELVASHDAQKVGVVSWAAYVFKRAKQPQK